MRDGERETERDTVSERGTYSAKERAFVCDIKRKRMRRILIM